jgi:sulfur carrier protein ThiS
MSAPIKFTVQKDGQTTEREADIGITVGDLLDQLGLFPDSFIVTLGGTPVPLTTFIRPGYRLKIIKVASGG